MSNPGQIGRVSSVASTKVQVRLDSSATGLSKIGIDGIATVGAVNSYIVIPTGPYRVVAIVTAVRIAGEDRASGPLHQLQSIYELDAIVTGRFEGDEFKSGLAGYPPLHAPVFCASNAETARIFVPGGGPALRIGSSSVASEQDVMLDANLLLSHHTVIVGSTGTGKSCTVKAILDGVLEMGVPGAHIVIFDINGEYHDCFGSESEPKVQRFLAGPNPGPDSGLVLPHWFMNNEEHLALFRASEGVQAPVLQRAIADARLADAKQAIAALDLRVASETAGLLESMAPGPNPQKNVKNQLLSFHAFLQALSAVESQLQSTWDALRQECETTGKALALTPADWTPLTPEQRKLLGSFTQRVRADVRQGYNLLGLGSSTASADFDAPAYYHLEGLVDTYLPQRIALEQQSDTKIAAYVSTLQMRLSRMLADGRYDFMTRVPKHEMPLGTFLRAVLGAEPLRGDPESDWPGKGAYEFTPQPGEHLPSVTIFDLSLIAADVLETVTALIGRLIFDFAVRSEPRAAHPILLVLEEAHRFVPRDQSGVGARSAAVFERIAKEGRKFGVGLVLASQRPSELAETVVAQCGTVIAHRLTHEADQALLRYATPFVSHDLLSQLPGLAQQHALITGVATAVPVAVKIRDVADRPRSNDPDFIARWRDQEPLAALGEHIDRVATAWEVGSTAPPG